MGAVELHFEATRGSGPVSARLLRPDAARWLLVLGHGAGAGMRHPFMEAIAAGLAARGVASLRYQVPYMEAGRRGPDPQPVLLATVRAAVGAAATAAGDLCLAAGGKSMGGRMTSLAAAREPLPGVRRIVFLGFPLHAAGRTPSGERGLHLSQLKLPILFVQGARDRLADLERLRPLCASLGATLRVVEGADHSFHVPRRSGRSDAEAIEEVATAVAGWLGDPDA